jgi:hypothetical protein
VAFKEEVEHGIQGGFNHRNAVGRLASAIPGCLHQRRDAVASDDVPHEHRRLKQM